MRVLFKDEIEYLGFNKEMKRYSFQNKYGDILLLKQAKLVDKAKDIVLMYLNTQDEAKVELSYSTKRKIEDRKRLASH